MRIPIGHLNSCETKVIWTTNANADIKIWRMTLKTIGRIYYVTSSFVHNFVAISQLKLK